MEESVKKLKGVVETIKNPNAAEDYSKDFKQISEEAEELTEVKVLV